ncbi:MAG: ATP-binding protein [Bacilli bacterium]
MDPITFNAAIEFCGAICSIIGFLFLLLMKEKNDKNRYVKILLMLNCTAVMFFDAISFLTRGNDNDFCFYMARISSFFVFLFNFIYIGLFMTYIWKLVKKDDEKNILRVYVVYGISLFGILFLIIGQFFGWIFTYDDANNYARGKLWFISQIIVFASLLIALSVFFQYRKRLQKVIFNMLCGYFLCLLISTILEIIFSQIAVQNMTTVLATIFILIAEAYNYRVIINEYKKKELDSLKDIDKAYKDLSLYQNQIEKTLQGASTGLWSLEVVLGQDTKLICDDNMKEILGFDKNISPEECYIEFNKRLVKEDLNKFGEYNRQLVEEGKGEVIYRWNHPTLGETYMRCGGWRDYSFTHGVLCRGYHSNVTEVQKKELKHEEDLKNALYQANEANKAKTEFLSTMSHDIRTPMNAIMGLTAIAKKQELNDVLKDCINKIEMSSVQLLSLINDVLDMNKIESGKTVLEHVSLSIINLVKDNIALIHEQAIENNITVEVKFDVKNEHIFGSPIHIKQILSNLLTNAIKYNKENGSIVISVKEVSIDSTHSNYIFKVADTGLGMSDEFQKIIFDPFTQENGGARTKYKGTGLGMSIVKKLVEKMNGTISLKSKLNIGSTFTFTIPFEIDDEPLLENKNELDIEEIQSKIKGIRVLLAEDNELNREIAKTLLEEYDIIIEEAEDGKICFDKFVKSEINYFQCILMDLRMPNMDGIEATKQIRSLDRVDAWSIPIIAMTADAFQEDVQRVKDAGMNEHLSKPLDINKVISTIASFLK